MSDKRNSIVCARLLSVLTFWACCAVLTFPATSHAACVKGVKSWDTLRIRSKPHHRAKEVGRIPFNACKVTISGKCRRGWCPVKFRSKQGWASSHYLSRKPGTAKRRRVNKRSAGRTKKRSFCVHNVGPNGVLQVRGGPGHQFVPLYGFRAGTCGIIMTGRCRGTFCPVRYKKFRGWADRRKLQ